MISQPMQQYPHTYFDSPGKSYIHQRGYSDYDSSCSPNAYHWAATNEVHFVSAHHSSYRTIAKSPVRYHMEEEGIQPHANDVLMGRGGKNNAHTGNERLREMARVEAENYRSSTKKGKSQISRRLVGQMCELDPPARFLKRNNDGTWEEMGEDTAREKASQVLRDAVNALPLSEVRQTNDDEVDDAEDDDDSFVEHTPRLSSGTRSRPRNTRVMASRHTPTPGAVVSLPPPTPVAGRSRKRTRSDPYDSPSHEYHGYKSYAQNPAAPSPLSSSHLGHEYYAADHHRLHSSSRAYAANQYGYHEHHHLRFDGRPERPPPIDNRGVSSTSTHSLGLGGVRDHPAGEADFELFQGELLASDDEGNEFIPPASRLSRR